MQRDETPTGDIFFSDLEAGQGIAPEEARERVDFFVRRIREKIGAYEKYQFSKHESRALNVFFDLAQEFTAKQDLWVLSVVIPKVFFDKEANLFLLNAEKRLEWRCCSVQGCFGTPPGDAPEPPLVERPEIRDGHYLLPIKGNHELISQLPFEPERDVIGLLDITPGTGISDHEKLFFEKYANRIGYRIHNRLIASKNQEHLEFIRSLVQDIGHNVIVPNMYFKLFYRRLESRIMFLRDIAAKFSEFSNDCALDDPERMESCKRLQTDMDAAFAALMGQYREIYRHYEQTSMFLETLLRRSHFEQGRYVLEMRPCNLRTQIVEPQLERYRARLAERGIQVDAGPGAHENPDPQVLADVGLISQVVANLFSNAVKYARPSGEDSPPRVVYDWEIVSAIGERPVEAIKISVFSTGQHLAENEASRLYSEGFRGANASTEYGTGHGLSFIKEVVGLHSGAVGYERAEGGNRFHFYLPAQTDD